jgi:mannose-6-phosphate isomerase-like protein (cupin superfamily)
MHRILVAAAIPLAFAAGFAASRGLTPAQAADAALSPAVIDLLTMPDAQIGPTPASGNFRASTLVQTQYGTVGIQTGYIVKHTHTNNDEIQYILSGSGSFWLGDKQMPIHPGDLVVIPKGTPHAGAVPAAGSGPIRSISIKLPPQAAGDFHPLQ